MWLDDEIEVLRPEMKRGCFRFVLFDFDGTLSLIREGWPQVMIPMMTSVLRETGTAESDNELTAAVEEFVMRLNGRQTIYQMIQLADEVRARKGTPLDPLVYKHRYHDLLMQRIEGRLESLRTGAAKSEDWTVPGSHALLAALKKRGLTLFLASGTDEKFVKQEAELLDVSWFFGPHIYGALDDHGKFSKKMIIERILKENCLAGEELLGFGDGFVEIEEIRGVGGVAVAVASDEVKRQGINAWKRNRLVQAGADVVIPEYRKADRLLAYLFDGQ
jgi:phosphoglycolate phosphatase